MAPKQEPPGLTEFQSLAKKLVAVPKKELDAEIRKEERAKAKRKAQRSKG